MSTNHGPAKMAEKIDMCDFPLHDCTQEQNSSPYFSSIVDKANDCLCQKRFLRSRNSTSLYGSDQNRS